ncbi:hypothetical protein HvAV-3i_gp093 [Heliothis virescens ascovirus 3i]|nr:hypothetical protein HvAV-3i_gp093 [Heliothis virescens ascovirus 3i]
MRPINFTIVVSTRVINEQLYKRADLAANRTFAMDRRTAAVSLLLAVGLVMIFTEASAIRYRYVSVYAGTKTCNEACYSAASSAFEKCFPKSGHGGRPVGTSFCDCRCEAIES